MSYDCSGEKNGYGECAETNTNGNAAFTAWSQGWGIAEGYSFHWYHRDGTRHDLPNRTLNLNSGRSPEEECEEVNGTWDPMSETCDLNNNEPSSPIVIATASGAYRFTAAEDGVMFDIDGDGVAEKVGWTLAGTEVAFLAIDRDRDGRITSGRELFGDSTIPGVLNWSERRAEKSGRTSASPDLVAWPTGAAVRAKGGSAAVSDP